MERPSLYMYGLGQISAIIAFSGLIFLYAGRVHFIIAVFAAAILAISAISTLWSGLTIGRGKNYYIGLSIRHCALTFLFVLLQVSGVPSGGQLWLILAAFSVSLTIMFSICGKIRHQDCIVEEWEKSGKLNAEKKQIRLDASDSMRSKKETSRFGIPGWIGVLAFIGAWFATKVFPELSAPIVRLVFLGSALLSATRSSYPISTAIILGRIEKRLGGPLLTEYGKRQ